jgi:hypothetical protein
MSRLDRQNVCFELLTPELGKAAIFKSDKQDIFFGRSLEHIA